MAIYAVTGAAGFIGSHLADRLLAAGHQVRVLDDLSTGKRANLDPRAALTVGDVADAGAVRALLDGADGVFHLAAIASVARTNEAWVETHRTNLTGTITVLDAARARRLPVVYASSAAVYGVVSGRPASEDLRPSPLSAYGADKLGSELHAAAGWHVHGIPSVGLRFFNVYGPRQDPTSPYSGVISIFARRVLAGAGIEIHGDGQQVRDFVHVADVVSHLVAAMTRAAGHGGAEVANVCTGRGTTVLALAHAIAAAAGLPLDVRHGPARPGDIRESIGDPAHAIALLGLTATTTLADGLADLLAWSREAA